MEKRVPTVKEYLVQWKGYDTSQMTWHARSSLLADVPTVLLAYEKSPTTAQARASAPKRAPTMTTANFSSSFGAPCRIVTCLHPCGLFFMRQFMICFAGFVKSARSNRVVRAGRLLGSLSQVYSIFIRSRVCVVCLFYSFVLEPGVLDSVT
jgi:hypothetical protein